MSETNPILDEIHRVREELAAKAGGDLHTIVAQARERALLSARAIEPHRTSTDKYRSATQPHPMPNQQVRGS